MNGHGYIGTLCGIIILTTILTGKVLPIFICGIVSRNAICRMTIPTFLKVKGYLYIFTIVISYHTGGRLSLLCFNRIFSVMNTGMFITMLISWVLKHFLQPTPKIISYFIHKEIYSSTTRISTTCYCLPFGSSERHIPAFIRMQT